MKNVAIFVREVSADIIKMVLEDLEPNANITFYTDYEMVMELVVGNKIDVLVLGNKLPCTVSGLDVAHNVKMTNDKVKIALISSVLPGYTKAFHEAGAVDMVFDKSAGFNAEKLQAWFTQVLN